MVFFRHRLSLGSAIPKNHPTVGLSLLWTSSWPWCSLHIRGLLSIVLSSTGGPSSSCEMIILHWDWVCSELKWNYSTCAWILRWICGRPVILSLDFSLLGSGVRKWSVQPWAFLMYVENLEMDNSLKWALFIKVSGQITSNTLWK